MMDKVQKKNFTYYNAPSSETFRLRHEFFVLATTSTPVLGTNEPLMGTAAPYPEVNRLERQANHTPPSNARLRIYGALPPIPYTPSWCVYVQGIFTLPN
jgi:hypothetical protein